MHAHAHVQVYAMATHMALNLLAATGVHESLLRVDTRAKKSAATSTRWHSPGIENNLGARGTSRVQSARLFSCCLQMLNDCHLSMRGFICRAAVFRIVEQLNCAESGPLVRIQVAVSM